MNLDLTEVLFVQRSKPRGDQLDAHVSDISGCDRATWLRRQGQTPVPFTREKLARFAIGRGYEDSIKQDLIASGRAVEQGQVIYLDGVKGHVDLVIDSGEPIEIKTSGLRSPKKYIATHYALQALSYAIGLGCKAAHILVCHIGDLNRVTEVQYRVHVDELAVAPNGRAFPEDSIWYATTWGEIIKSRCVEVKVMTDPKAPIPIAEPGELSPWGCKYCDWHQCQRNPLHKG